MDVIWVLHNIHNTHIILRILHPTSDIILSLVLLGATGLFHVYHMGVFYVFLTYYSVLYDTIFILLYYGILWYIKLCICI